MPPVSIDSSSHSDTNVCYRRSYFVEQSCESKSFSSDSSDSDSDSVDEDDCDGDPLSAPSSSDCDSQLEDGDHKPEVELVSVKAAYGV